MPVHGEHFVGYDPTKGLEQFGICPALNDGAVVVWYEHWAFTGYSIGIMSATGIYYTHGFTAFDMLGNVITKGSPPGFKSCSFLSNETCRGNQTCPSDEEWLARARAACEPEDLPPAGTIQFVPSFGEIIGR